MLLTRPSVLGALAALFGFGVAQTTATTATATTVTPAVTQLTLSNNFEITNVPATRTYDWTVATMTGAPDGYYRPMLVVNGKCIHIRPTTSDHSYYIVACRSISWSDY
jgi:hypothetical protein